MRTSELTYTPSMSTPSTSTPTSTPTFFMKGRTPKTDGYATNQTDGHF